MKVYCKRTRFFQGDRLWELGKLYDYRLPNDYEKEYVYLYIKFDSNWLSIDSREFNKYFETLEDHRNNIINKIIK